MNTRLVGLPPMALGIAVGAFHRSRDLQTIIRPVPTREGAGERAAPPDQRGRDAIHAFAFGLALAPKKDCLFYYLVDRGRGRIALESRDGRYVSVQGTGNAGEVTLRPGKPGDGETFQWVDLQRGETLLLSLATHRYLAAPSAGGAVSADHPGPEPGRKDGSCFQWKPAPR